MASRTDIDKRVRQKHREDIKFLGGWYDEADSGKSIKSRSGTGAVSVVVRSEDPRTNSGLHLAKC